MDRHGLRKKNEQVSHQVVKQLADSVAILLQSISISIHLHISLALNTKQKVAGYVNKMLEYSCSTASPASSNTVTVHKDDSYNNVHNLRLPLLGRCDNNYRHLVENYLPRAPVPESSDCTSIDARFSVDINLRTARVTRSNTMDPCDIQDALVDTAWSSQLMVLDGKCEVVPISQKCDAGMCFDTNISRVPINTQEPVSWGLKHGSHNAIATIKGGMCLPTAEG